MQYVNFNQGEITWHGPHQQHKICVLVLKSQCISQIDKQNKPFNKRAFLLNFEHRHK
jgi:hypothetical protein